MFIVFEILLVLLTVLYSYIEAFIKLFYNPQKDVSGRVALITGAGGGIGRQLAFQLAQRKVKLALWDVNKDSVDTVCNDLQEQGFTNVFAYQCDITKKTEVSRVAAETRRDLGEVELLFNNAGVLTGKDILDLSEGEIRRTMEVNIISQFWTVQEFLPSMLKKNYGHIIITASMASHVGAAWLTDYCASKFAVKGFSDALALDLLRRKSNIKVSTAFPLMVNTNLMTGVADHCQPYSRIFPVMEPDFVAAAIIDGMLRNQRSIFIPKDMFATTLTSSLIPRRGFLAINNFVGAGYFPKDMNLQQTFH